ncbi:MAG: hypothetical protein JXM72_03410 [Deltaproteobacteria bacterium]|nr:hypothetical protein [Deltaproteobacteria bacterium]
MKNLFRFFGVMAGILILVIVISACSPDKTIEVDVPDDIKTQLEKGAPKDKYTFYALADSQSLTWNNFKEQGLWICGGLPPLIPEKYRSLINSDGFPAGTALTINKDSDEIKNLGLNIVVAIGVELNGCVNGVIEKMSESPGLILLVERKTDFKDKDKLIKVSFK